jgi:hypothetical protein
VNALAASDKPFHNNGTKFQEKSSNNVGLWVQHGGDFHEALATSWNVVFCERTAASTPFYLDLRA